MPMKNAPQKLWRVVGTSPGNHPARMTIAADTYAEAKARAIKARITIQDLVLIKEMTPKAYSKAIETVGLSQVKASDFFEVARKTSPRWARGEAPIPGSVKKLLSVMIAKELTPEEVDKLE